MTAAPATTMMTTMTTSATQVKWYLDGILLRKLPDCSNGTDRCNMVSAIITNSSPSNIFPFQVHSHTTITTYHMIFLSLIRKNLLGPKQSDFGKRPENLPWELLLPGIYAPILLCIITGATIRISIKYCCALFFLSLSRERTGQGGELSPTQVKSCF